MTTATSFLNEAQALTSMGFSVIPVGRDKRPRIPGKTREERSWNPYRERIADRAELEAWFAPGLHEAFGIVCGALSGRSYGGHLVVLDLEERSDHEGIRQQVRDVDAETAVQLTPGGGAHTFVISRKPCKNMTVIDPNEPEGSPDRHRGDVKAEGGYVLGGPSLHPNGGRYQWVTPLPLLLVVDDALEFFRNLVEPIGYQIRDQADPARPDETRTKIAEVLATQVGTGQRHQTLVRIAGWARNIMSQSEAESVCQAWNVAACKPPLGAIEVTETVEDIYARYEAQATVEVILDSLPVSINRESRIEKPPGFELASVADLLSEAEEPTPWLIEGLLPSGGVSLLGARPKIGKTTFARYLARCVARGEPFLGRATAQGPVLLFLLEEKRGAIRERFRQLGITNEPIFVHVGAAPKDALAAFELALAKHRPVLAVADPVLKLVRLRDANDYAEVSAALEPVIELARRYGCHLMLNHHLGKSDRADGDDILGSTAIFGAVDTAIIMKRRDQGRTVQTIQRYGDDMAETVVGLNDDGTLNILGAVAGILLRQAAETVMETIGDQDTLTEAEIREKAGGNATLVGKALRQLHEEGKLTRTGAGKRGSPYKYSRPE